MKSPAPISFPLLALVCTASAWAMPDFRTVDSVAGLQLVRDDQSALVRYYFPPDPRLAASPEGRPAIDVLETRYRGTGVSGDSGKELFFSFLRLTLRIPPPPAPALSEVRRRLGPRMELRPLPLDRIRLVVLHLPVGGEGEGAKARVLPAGASEPAEPPRDGRGNAAAEVWSEHHETVRLDANSAQLLADSWKHGRLLLSVGYTLYGSGIAPDAPLAQWEGNPEMLAELKRLAPVERATNDAPVLVRAGAIGVSVDAARWPETWKRYDLNEGTPPGYPLLEVRCYDFSGDAPTPLYEKQLFIEADSVAGSRAAAALRFERGRQEATAQWVRFRVGVKLDRPYRYRVESVLEDGTAAATPWATNHLWSQLIDISETNGPMVSPSATPATQP